MSSASATPLPGSDHPKAAPGELDQIRCFVNSADIGEETDDIADPEALHDWLVERRLLAEGEPVTESDVRQAAAVREALRALLLANNGDPLDPAAIETLNAAAKSAELLVRFDGHGHGALAPVRPGFDGALAELLAIVARAMAEDTWPRLKACGAHDCNWAFYDWSKNRSATWCKMETCGNREKARAYRRRHAHAARRGE